MTRPIWEGAGRRGHGVGGQAGGWGGAMGHILVDLFLVCSFC